MINSLPEYQAIIVANGSVIDRKDILRLNNTFIIATDGSYAKCKRLKIVPNLIIGDMDSITDQNYEGILYQYIDNQDNTDLEKAIIYCKSP
jgi:thiamine pyrophosphokinase